ncbi:uncharacterized protein LOC134290852 [Aedes albopictus]|uniref:Reverse transcriptase domain-containing protein n=1 Tax=Aedes albopictus TaxID=7160 RepID=A0ABM1YAE4_AEDAL
MGNPLSPIIADLVMEDILDEATSKSNHTIPYIRKYVDDLFLVLRPEQVQSVLNTFNEVNPSIQFTAEREEESRLPFLDMTLVRQQDQTVKTEWYSKSIASGRFLNYYSGHPMHQKINVAENFARRVMLFSTNLDIQSIKTTIHQQLKANDYPTCLINKITNRAKHRAIENDTAMDVSTTQQTDTKFYSLTNIEGLTQQI